MNCFVVDGGTTNTRVTLLVDSVPKQFKKIAMGIKHSEALKEELKQTISQFLSIEGLDESNVAAVIASGSITSELGLWEVPHCIAPVNCNTLAQHIVNKVFPEICTIPFCFIPGVKNGDLTDFMRGEETEFFGLPCGSYESQSAVLLIPGSHTKLVFSENGKITGCQSTLLGEMMKNLSSGTILESSLGGSLDNADADSCVMGYQFAVENGLNRALFYVRVLDRSFHWTKEKLRGFFIGAVMRDDISLIQSSAAKDIFVAGSDPLRHIFCHMLSTLTDKNVINFGDESDRLQLLGAQRIFREYVEGRYGNEVSQ